MGYKTDQCSVLQKRIWVRSSRFYSKALKELPHHISQLGVKTFSYQINIPGVVKSSGTPQYVLNRLRYLYYTATKPIINVVWYL